MKLFVTIASIIFFSRNFLSCLEPEAVVILIQKLLQGSQVLARGRNRYLFSGVRSCCLELDEAVKSCFIINQSCYLETEAVSVALYNNVQVEIVLLS